MIDARNNANLLYLPLDKLLQQAAAAPPAPARCARRRRADRDRRRRRAVGSVDVRSRDEPAQPRPRQPLTGSRR